MFTEVIDLLPLIILVGFLFIIISIILNIYSRTKLSFTTFLIAGGIFVSSVSIFFVAMSELAKVSVGSFIGEGNIDIDIPGEKIYVTMASDWGPGIGFYFLLCAIIILVFVFVLKVIKIKKSIRKS